jgi:hypothetical protein
MVYQTIADFTHPSSTMAEFRLKVFEGAGMARESPLLAYASIL